jgi:membrane-bound lytic murein transglycosylase A
MVNPATKRVVPYDSRQKINAEKDFYTRSEPVAWLKSRVDRFFLEIQGSGRIDLGKGEILGSTMPGATARPIGPSAGTSSTKMKY